MTHTKSLLTMYTLALKVATWNKRIVETHNCIKVESLQRRSLSLKYSIAIFFN